MAGEVTVCPRSNIKGPGGRGSGCVPRDALQAIPQGRSPTPKTRPAPPSVDTDVAHQSQVLHNTHPREQMIIFQVN